MSLLIPSVTDTRISKFTLSSLLYMVCDVDTVIYITHAYYNKQIHSLITL